MAVVVSEIAVDASDVEIGGVFEVDVGVVVDGVVVDGVVVYRNTQKVCDVCCQIGS